MKNPEIVLGQRMLVNTRKTLRREDACVAELLLTLSLSVVETSTVWVEEAANSCYTFLLFSSLMPSL